MAHPPALQTKHGIDEMDLKINQTTYDLAVENYDLVLNSGLDLAEQRILQSLKFFLGEWYLDVNSGIPYFRDILIKAPDQNTVESVLKNAILQTEGVIELRSFSVEYENSPRLLRLSFRVLTDAGIVTINEAI